MDKRRKPAPGEAYTAEYYVSECDGHEEYARTGGEVLPPRLAQALLMAGDLSGLRVLDLGCGRGEVVCHCLGRGALAVGVDYSSDALALTRAIVPLGQARLARSDAQSLPFPAESFDLAFALDLVEHLHPPELERMLAEAYRVLVPQGRLLIHTMPNGWYYRIGYPLYRLVQRMRGARLPRDPRDRWRYVSEMHVNEQSVVSLSRSLRRAGFRAKVRLHNLQGFGQESNPLVRAVMKGLATAYPFAWVFCNDLLAVAVKGR